MLIGQSLRLNLIKFSSLVYLLFVVCICNEHDMVLSSLTPRYVCSFLFLVYDPLMYSIYTHIVGDQRMRTAQHAHLISFPICWSIHTLYIDFLVTDLHLVML